MREHKRRENMSDHHTRVKCSARHAESSRERIQQDRPKAIAISFEGELGLEPPLPRRAKCRATLWCAQETHDRRRERLTIVRIDQYACLSVDDDVRRGIVCATNARKPGAHRVEIDETETLTATWKREQRHSLAQRLQRPIRNEAEKQHIVREAERCCLLTKTCYVIALPYDHELRSRKLPYYSAPAFQKLIVPLV